MCRKLLLSFTIVGYFLFFTQGVRAQDTLLLNLDQVVKIADEQSPMAILAKHQFRASYWSFRTYQAKYRPMLSLNATVPDYNRVFEREYDFNTGQEYYVEKNTNNSTLGLSFTQNIGLTGGSIFTQSDITRFDAFGSDRTIQFITTPVSIGLSQPLFDYNPLKWEKRIEPIKYEEAKKSYLDAIENVNMRAVNYFFNLVLAQLNQEISRVNYSNADTLYQIAQGRYNIGTIAEDELLQMELSLLNAGTALNEAGIDLKIREFQLKSFLGYNENVNIELVIPKDIPDITVDVNDVIALAQKNNPDILDFQRQLLEAQRDVEQAKREKGLNATLYATFGLTQRANDFKDAYRDPLDQQRVRIGFQMPILDWGLGRGKYELAQSNEEVVKTNVEQSQIDFQQNIILNVAQFNLQDDQVLIAAKADTTARKRYEVTKQRFLIGKIAVLDLNVADSEKDVARRGYISALRDYWTDFYTLRQLTLYDFMKKKDLAADFDKLVE